MFKLFLFNNNITGTRLSLNISGDGGGYGCSAEANILTGMGGIIRTFMSLDQIKI